MKNKVKKAIYLTLWVIVGVLLTTMLGGIIEVVSFWIYGSLELVVVLYGAMVVAGIIFGLFCGPVAWRKIYVEGLRGEKYVVK